MTKTKETPPDFEQQLQQLERVVNELEQSRLTLEQMLEKYAIGVDLIQACRSILEQAEQMLPVESAEGELWR